MSFAPFGILPPDVFPPDVFGPGAGAGSMALQYNVYRNAGAGDAVDYTSLVASTTAHSWTIGPLTPGGDHAFGVRVQDTDSGLEEKNVDCRIRIVLDSSGNDITGRPRAPLSVSAQPAPAAGVRVHWMRNPIPSAAALPATGYHVYIGSPAPDFSTPAATVSDTGARDFTTLITGLVDGTTYQVVVRAYNAVAEEPNTNAVSVTAKGSAPSPVDALSVAATFTGPS